MYFEEEPEHREWDNLKSTEVLPGLLPPWIVPQKPRLLVTVGVFRVTVPTVSPRNCPSLTITLYLGSRLWGFLPWGQHHNPAAENKIS